MFGEDKKSSTPKPLSQSSSQETSSRSSMVRAVSLLPSTLASPAPQFTFSHIIDADHTTINAAALSLRNTTSSQIALRRALRDELIWRLIRHDVSEDLVMRPAFITHLGAEGQRYCDEDKADHENARQALLKLYALPLDHPEFINIIRAFFKTLADHMKAESGEQIPRLEGALDRTQSERLGKEYLDTQVLMPDLMVSGQRIWNGIEDYARTPLSRFKEVMAQVEAEQRTQPGAKGRL